MRFNHQTDSYSCGIHSVRNAASLLGISVTFEDAKKITGAKSYFDSAQENLTTIRLIKSPVKSLRKFIDDVGTSETQIKRGLKKLGLSYTEFHSDDSDKFLKFLDKHSGPVIMLVNFTLKSSDTGHWVVCRSRNENKYKVIDSAPWTGKPRQWYTSKKLLRRFVWYDEDAKEYYEFYAIAVK